jgi:DtxR family Mn-dependent transcriptional regulator
LLSEIEVNAPGIIVAVKDTSSTFLQQIERLQLQIGTGLTVKERMPFDNSIHIQLANNRDLMLSEKIALNIIVSTLDK